MLLRLTHETDLTYSELISESVVELRVAPRQEQDQHRLSFELAVGPAGRAVSYFDWLGNTVHTFNVNAFHRKIRIVATSVVETDRPRKEPERFKDTWPVPLGHDYRNYDFIHFGGPVVDCAGLRSLVDVLGAKPDTSMGELALRMLYLIDERFEYRKGITTAASPITELLEHGKGVCQDFTHLMIGLARAMGIPARYVSGLVHPDAERFRGYAQTHAWCELYFPSAGWIGFDPTNKCIVGANFVKVAIGRDFRDVAPNKGVYRGKAKETIDVRVTSEALGAIPSELAAERARTLPVETFAGNAPPDQDQPNQQPEMQQQQQQQQQMGR